MFWFMKVIHRWPSTLRLRSSLAPPASSNKTLGFLSEFARPDATAQPAGPPEKDQYLAHIDLVRRSAARPTSDNYKVISVRSHFSSLSICAGSRSSFPNSNRRWNNLKRRRWARYQTNSLRETGGRESEVGGGHTKTWKLSPLFVKLP